MDLKTQSKPTYRIEETRELLPKLVDQVVQSNSFNEKNIKEEIEELISNDPSFVRSISNAISNIPSAGGSLPRVSQEPDGVVKPIEMPFEEVKEGEGSFVIPNDGNKVDVDDNVSKTSESSSDSSSVLTIGESIKSEIYSLAQSLMNELRSLGGKGSSGDDRASIVSPEDLRQAANEAGKGKGPDGSDIRFERNDDGTFTQFIDGSQGDVFTEDQLRDSFGSGGGVSSGVPSGNNPANLTGEELRQTANEAGEGQAPNGGDIRFERNDDGTFTQYVDGSKGEDFTEQELQESLAEKNKESGSEDENPSEEQDRAEDSSKTSKTSDDSFPVPLDVTGEICIVGIDTFEIWDKINANQSNSTGLTLEAEVNTNSGFPSVGNVSFIDEYDPDTSMSQLMTFEGSGADRKQTKWKLPLAKKHSSSGGWQPLSQGGYYNLSLFCVNGIPCQYPLKNF